MTGTVPSFVFPVLFILPQNRDTADKRLFADLKPDAFCKGQLLFFQRIRLLVAYVFLW